MKAILRFVLLLACAVSSAFATSLSGTLVDARGNPVTGTLVLSLSRQESLIVSNSCSPTSALVNPTPIKITVTNGVLISPPSITGNDCLAPASSYYNVKFIDPNGNLLWSDFWIIVGTSEDVGAIVSATLTGTYIALPASTIAGQAFDPTQPIFMKNLNNVRYARQYLGSDCGAQVNNAYADLSATGGVIVVDTSCVYSTPIVFATANKPVTLEGYPAGAVTMTFTGGPAATAITFNYGGSSITTGKPGAGLRDLTLIGPGGGSGDTGIVLGGTHGATGATIVNVFVSSFSTGLLFSHNTNLVEVSNSTFSDSNKNLYIQYGLTNSGNGVRFSHVTFANAPPPHTNNVWVQGVGQHVVFEDCSFMQAQLTIGQNGTTGPQVTVNGAHFENNNVLVGGSGAVDYDFILMYPGQANYLRLTDSMIYQDRTSGGAYAELLSLNGGQTFISGVGVSSPSSSVPITAFIDLSGLTDVTLYGYNDIWRTTVALFGGSTTGYIMSFPGVPSGLSAQAFNNIIGASDLTGGALFDVGGDIRAKGHRLISTIATGTSPLSVTSTTPVSNLFANPNAYTASGTQVTSTVHAVYGQGTLSGTTATITLSGAAVYTNATSYTCTANDTAAAVISVSYVSGTQFTLGGTSGHSYSYQCLGN